MWRLLGENVNCNEELSQLFIFFDWSQKLITQIFGEKWLFWKREWKRNTLGTDSAAKWLLAHFCSQMYFHVHGSWAAGNGILLALDEIGIPAPSLQTTFLLPIG